MTRIAFAFSPGAAWIGGLSYYDNLLTIVNRERDPQKYRLIGLLPTGDIRFDGIARHFDEVYKIAPASLFGKGVNNFSRILSEKNSTAWLSPESPLSRSLRHVHADVVFLKEDPLANFRVPTVCWFPDFQYLHMPEMFTSEDARVYARVVRNTARFATRVMLSSESVRRDFMTTLPEFVEKVRIIPFTTFIDENVYLDNPVSVVSEYHLPEKFFFMPNQFWKHKNHRVVLEALDLLKKSGHSVTVVASGPLEDNRNSSYPFELLADISRRDLRSEFIILGMVPRRHVYALIRQSIALLQPSLFEGWSSSIEEAKSLGKTVIASDLDVHFEQNAPGAVYFERNNPNDLAKCLSHLFTTLEPGVDKNIENNSKETMHAKAKEFGEAFLAVVCESAA